MTANERLKMMVRNDVLRARDAVLRYCPDGEAQKQAVEHLNKSIEYAGKALDGIETRRKVLVPGN